MSYEIPVLKLAGAAQTTDQITARIANLDQIIALYEAAMITGAAGASMVEYELDTGQTKQRVKHSEPTSMIKALESLQMQRDRLAVKLQPRSVRLINHGSFRNNF